MPLKWVNFIVYKLYSSLKSELGWGRRSIEGEIRTLLDFLMLKKYLSLYTEMQLVGVQ